MYRGKRQIGEISGFPQYENGAVAITRRGQEVWLPVTREELLRAHLADLRASRGMESLAARYEQELATLDDRSGPAYCCHEDRAHPSGTTSSKAEGASPIVRLNPTYVDRSASATVQLLVIGTEQTYAVERAAKPTDPNFELLRAISEKLDWATLATMVR